MKSTGFLKLNIRDFIHGLLMAVGSGVIAIIAPSMQNGTWVFDWTMIWHTAVASAFAYLAKNLFTPTPKQISIDPAKTSVIDKNTKQPILRSNNFNKQ